MKQAFNQDVIAVIWDFDKTLAKDYMQKPIFEKYNVNEIDFWKENNELYEKYKSQGIKINKDTIYLNHLLTCVKQGIFPGLNNALLKELGKEIKLYDGLPEFFNTITNLVKKDENYRKHNITVEHYIVSTGLSKMIRGSSIADYVDGIWGCEFIEDPVESNLGKKESDKIGNTLASQNVITQIGYAIDNTSKTRALFEINKGANIYDIIDVNSDLSAENRRIPFKNMIYIADGPSDVPAFSIVKKNGGKTFAVYPKGNSSLLRQVDRLREESRIDMYGEADYSENTTTYMWILEQVRNIANRIYDEKESLISGISSSPPKHQI